MNPMPEIIPMLKELRLSGVMDSLENRNRQAIEEKLSNNVHSILEISQGRGCLPREAAVDMAMQRVNKAMALRRWSLF